MELSETEAAVLSATGRVTLKSALQGDMTSVYPPLLTHLSIEGNPAKEKMFQARLAMCLVSAIDGETWSGLFQSFVGMLIG